MKLPRLSPPRWKLTTLLVVFTVGCIGLGWKARQVHLQRAAVAWVRGNGGEVYYSCELDEDQLGYPLTLPLIANPPGPDWVRSWIGLDWFDHPVGVYLSDSRVNELSPLQGLPRLKWLEVDNERFHDLRSLPRLASLKMLTLTGTNVGDIRPLQHLHQLSILYLNRTRVCDLSPLQDLHRMEALYLTSTEVRDIRPLQHLHNLNHLFLDDTRVRDTKPLLGLGQLKWLILPNGVNDCDVAFLRRQLPLCEIDHPDNAKVSPPEL